MYKLPYQVITNGLISGVPRTPIPDKFILLVSVHDIAEGLLWRGHHWRAEPLVSEYVCVDRYLRLLSIEVTEGLKYGQARKPLPRMGVVVIIDIVWVAQVETRLWEVEFFNTHRYTFSGRPCVFHASLRSSKH